MLGEQQGAFQPFVQVKAGHLAAIETAEILEVADDFRDRTRLSTVTVFNRCLASNRVLSSPSFRLKLVTLLRSRRLKSLRLPTISATCPVPYKPSFTRPLRSSMQCFCRSCAICVEECANSRDSSSGLSPALSSVINFSQCSSVPLMPGSCSATAPRLFLT